MKAVFSMAAVFLLALGVPALAYAWGPATHMEYASNALQFLAAFPPLIRMLLEKHQDHYLYGSIAADITLGKNARGYLYNCHNWTVALDLFHNKATNDSQRAFMLGYMGHLAADTVAHNFFVPFKLVRSWNTALLKHVYWEMRMDLSVPQKYWKMMEHFAGQDFSEDDALLEEHLKRTIFSFKVNKKIFNSLIVLQQMEQYKKITKNVADKSVWVLAPEDIRNYKELALKGVVDFLTKLEDSFVLKADPTGKLKMLYAREAIGHLREANRYGKLKIEQEKLILTDVKKGFQASIYENATMPSVRNYLA